MSVTGQWLDFHQLADYHASRTALAATIAAKAAPTKKLDIFCFS